MHKQLGEVWLPKLIMAAASVDTAGPSLPVKYTREFYDYDKTDAKVKLRFEAIEPPDQKP